MVPEPMQHGAVTAGAHVVGRAAAAVVIALATLAGAEDRAQVPPTVADAVRLVTRHYESGVPYSAARQLSRDAVPTLIAMLGEREHEPYLANVVVTLGIMGDGRATEALITLIEGTRGEVSLERFAGLVAVAAGLGHRARGGDARALAYLSDGTSPSQWQRRGLTWTFERYDGDRRNVLLAKVAVNGLAASGRPEALARLQHLRDAPESPAVAAALEPNVREGIAFHTRIRREGAERVFGTSGDEE